MGPHTGSRCRTGQGAGRCRTGREIGVGSIERVQTGQRTVVSSSGGQKELRKSGCMECSIPKGAWTIKGKSAESSKCVGDTRGGYGEQGWRTR